MVNKVTLIGHVGKDLEIRNLEGGASVTRFSVATNENYRDKNGEWQSQTEWHDIVAWRQLAERAVRDLKKGSLVFIEGKLTHRKWQDKDGIERYSTDILANNIRSLEKREGTGKAYEQASGEASSIGRPEDTHPAMPDENNDLPF